MQLGKLRAAIRKESTVKVIVEGLGVEVAVQKTDLLKALGERFDGQTVETGMAMMDGSLIVEGRGDGLEAFRRAPAEAVVEKVAQHLRAAADQLDIEDAITASKAADDDLLGDLF